MWQINNAKACLSVYAQPLIIDHSAGAWTLDEEARLDQIMQDLGEPGKTVGKTKYWVEVSEHMDKTCSAKQCSNKW